MLQLKQDSVTQLTQKVKLLPAWLLPSENWYKPSGSSWANFPMYQTNPVWPNLSSLLFSLENKFYLNPRVMLTVGNFFLGHSFPAFSSRGDTQQSRGITRTKKLFTHQSLALHELRGWQSIAAKSRLFILFISWNTVGKKIVAFVKY